MKFFFVNSNLHRSSSFVQSNGNDTLRMDAAFLKHTFVFKLGSTWFDLQEHSTIIFSWTAGCLLASIYYLKLLSVLLRLLVDFADAAFSRIPIRQVSAPFAAPVHVVDPILLFGAPARN